MTKLELVNKVSRKFHRVGFKLKKHSPEIMVVAGVVGTVASAIMACRATTKLSIVMDTAKKNANDINTFVEDNGYSEEYTEKDHKNDLTVTYANTGLDLVKLYAPSVILGALSISAILTSNHIMRKRNVALAAAYTAVDRSFKDYRNRVVERFGESLDRELKYNIKAKEITETVVNENGEETTVTKTVQTVDPNGFSIYACCFDEHCFGWDKDPGYNKVFLIQQQNYANELLKTRGHLFLNEVYDMLGVPRTSMGQIVGWIYDEVNPVGDNFVDFGIFDIDDESKRLFVNGHEKAIWLDFNVDGPIWELL